MSYRIVCHVVTWCDVNQSHNAASSSIAVRVFRALCISWLTYLLTSFLCLCHLIIRGGGNMFSGRPSVRPSVNTYFAWRDISVLSGRISMKLATCEWALLKSQGHGYTECYNGGGIPCDGVASRLTCVRILWFEHRVCTVGAWQWQWQWQSKLYLYALPERLMY